MHVSGAAESRGRSSGRARIGALVSLAGALAAALACAAPRATANSTGGTSASPGACANANLRPGTANARAVDAAVLCLINRVRVTHGLPALGANRALARGAAGKVRGMIRDDYFADDGPAGQTAMSLVAKTSYPAHATAVAVGQSLAWGVGRYATPAHTVAQWMASPSHREVLLDGEYREAGVAVAPGVPRVLRRRGHGRGATYAVELGARRF